jgi:copper chaperone CopZ
MKKLLYLSILAIAFIACNNDSKNNKDVAEPVAMELSIEGMTCNGCVGTVESSVKQMGEGIVSVKVSLDDANAIIEYNPEEVKPKKIKEAIELNGYKVVKMEERGSDD